MFKRRKRSNTEVMEPVEEVEVEEHPLEIEVEAPLEDMQRAIHVDREYIDIQKESLAVDVIEMLHFFNELPSTLPKALLQKNEEAIDYFRTLTGVYVGTPYDFYQTIVLFYYKNWHHTAYPFKGSQLEFAFSKVAHVILENLQQDVQQSYGQVFDIIEGNPKAFYLHEDQIERTANRFIRRMVTQVPELEVTAFYTPIEGEFVTLANEIYRDLREVIYTMEHQDFYDYDTMYRWFSYNDALFETPDLLEVRAFYYYPIKHVEIMRVLQLIRFDYLQQLWLQVLHYELSTQIQSIKTVRMLEYYLGAANDAMYSQNESLYFTNQRFLNLFFDHYYFEKGMLEDEDSPKVRHCLKQLLEHVNQAKANEEFTGELDILIKKAYYDHQLLAGD